MERELPRDREEMDRQIEELRIENIRGRPMGFVILIVDILALILHLLMGNIVVLVVMSLQTIYFTSRMHKDIIYAIS
jgi:hypothetical protein